MSDPMDTCMSDDAPIADSASAGAEEKQPTLYSALAFTMTTLIGDDTMLPVATMTQMLVRPAREEDLRRLREAHAQSHLGHLRMAAKCTGVPLEMSRCRNHVDSHFSQHWSQLQAPRPATDLSRTMWVDEKVQEVLASKGHDQCSICFAKMKVNDSVKVLPCGHVYHGGCITEWLQRSVQCPLCRHSVFEPRKQ